ncbi:MAG: FkbM family methyltransferase [Ruminococcaceae bacterium]|nr:FkbM family methyltransferase [Oscillospiraceae bacterium]
MNELFDRIGIDKDLWHYLKETDKPIVMYGMGNGADKILARFEGHGIEVSDFFASDGFVRGHSFHGKQVLSLAEIEEKYDDFIIILSFASSLDEVLDLFYSINEKHEMYAPDVPVTGDGTFDLVFFKNNIDNFSQARELLADNLSKNVFDNVIRYKLTGKISYLKEIETTPDEAWENILSPNRYVTAVDAGAYNGDTAKEMIMRCKNIGKIFALEPDARNYRKLNAFAETESRIEPKNAAAWNENTFLEFDSSGNRNANTFCLNTKKTITVEACTIDSVCSNSADYIKYDVEGAERNAVIGSEITIKNTSPDLLISLYHRNEDLFDLPLLINEINSDYKLYLRKFKYVPAWDLNLYAIK